MKKSAIVVGLALLSFSVTSQAGVYIFEQSPKGNSSKTYIEPDKFRADTIDAGKQETVIFRKDKNVFWTIDQQSKTYTEMTVDQLKKMMGGLGTAMQDMAKQMESQMQGLLKDMPADQKKMMEDAMKNMPKQPAPQASPTADYSVVYKKVADGIKVGNWTTSQYAGMEKGVKTEDVWSVPMSSVGLSADDFKIFQAFGDIFANLFKDAGPLFKVGSTDFEKQMGFPGVPVKTISYSGGKVTETMEVKDLKKTTNDAALFEIPAGLKKEVVPDMPMGMQPH